MPLVNQTRFADHKAAIRKWLSDRTGLPLLSVIWVNQITPRPDNPFATLQIVSPGKRQGLDYLQEVQNGGVIERHYIGLREMTVQAEVFTDPTTAHAEFGAIELLDQALMALSMQQVRDEFSAVDLAEMDYEIQDAADDQVGERWERRAVADVRFSYRTILFDDGTDPAPDDGTYIETVDPITQVNGTATWNE